jgi:hypothetical protein
VTGRVRDGPGTVRKHTYGISGLSLWVAAVGRDPGGPNVRGTSDVVAVIRETPAR